MIKNSLLKFLLVCLLLSRCASLFSTENNQKVFFVVEGRLAPNGLFSVFLVSLGALDFYEKNPGHGLWINLNGGLYYESARGLNWWEYYFEPVFLPPSGPWIGYSFPADQLASFGWSSALQMSRARGYELISKYVRLKPEIIGELHAFINTNFLDRYVIGIHYRGTDKIQEAPRLSYEEMGVAITNTINNIPSEKKNHYCLFVATDEVQFLQYVQNKFNCPILYTSALRSNNGQPVHFNPSYGNYLKGKEALLDCLLLSSCHYLIRTESNLSNVSTFFNPWLPVYTLKK